MDDPLPFGHPPERQHAGGVLLPCHPSSVRAARRFARERLHDADAAFVDVVELLVSEVVTNAVVHAHSPCRLRIGPLGPDGVRIEVQDDHPAAPRRVAAPGDGLHGRGLLILDELAHDWGCEPAIGPGKSIWFHVRR